jgi:hypothetical protein
VLNEFSDNRE